MLPKLGAHERFHLTLKEAMSPPEAERCGQQARFDAFRETYNMERPHEGLKMAAPGEVYEKSARRMPGALPEPDYPATAEVRQVRPNGEIKWRGGEIYVSQALSGAPVAIEDAAGDGHTVRYFNCVIGLLPRNASRLQPPPKLSPIQPG